MLSKDRFTLQSMLSYGRPALSVTERLFINRFIAPLPGAYEDPYRNWHVVIGDSPIVWSCHTDTVHRVQGMQTTHFDPKLDTFSLSRKSARYASCLGADDTAGVWLCIEMINARVAGHYIFHAQEECGGIGSEKLAKQAPEVFADTLFAIALDRKGYRDVITHQAMGRTCSDSFAEQLSTLLGMNYRPSDDGVFTDTANYSDLISECTNLSVGYDFAHTHYEELDGAFLTTLRDTLCSTDFSSLTHSRTPGDDDRAVSFNSYHWDSDSYADRVVVIDRYRNVPTDYLDADHYCDQCGVMFNPEHSDARVFTKFCDRDCEDLYRDTASWLDSNYAAVQAALRKGHV